MIPTLSKKNICPICGYDKLYEPPYDEHSNPSYEICPCCGFEYGYDDEDLGFTFDSYRKKWIEDGCQFETVNKMPSEWNTSVAKQQLENLKLIDK